MDEIFMPITAWLIGGSRIGGAYNVYTATVGTDPYKGCISEKIFNYRIWIEKIDEDEYLKAACYSGTNSFECQDESDITVETFPLTEDGRQRAKEFLEKQKEVFFSDKI